MTGCEIKQNHKTSRLNQEYINRMSCFSLYIGFQDGFIFSVFVFNSHMYEAKQKLEFLLDVSGDNGVRLGTTMFCLSPGLRASEFCYIYRKNI